MGTGTPRVAGHAGHLRLHENSSGGPADAAGPVPPGLPTDAHGQGNGYGHRRLETAESHRKRIQPL